MKRKSELREKSTRLAKEIIEICRICRETRVEFALYNQLLRSGTAVGALISEAEYAQSKADFISKLSIALKEAGETMYWLEVMTASGKIMEGSLIETVALLDEIIRMLIASVNTLKRGGGNAHGTGKYP